MSRGARSTGRRAVLARLAMLAGSAALPGALLRSSRAFAADGTPLVAPVRALVGGRVIDGTGGAPIDDATIVIENERIVAVGPTAAIKLPEGAEITSTEGMTVLPGLIDVQVHLARLGHGDVRRWDEAYVPLAERVVMPIAAKQLLMAGVTTARDVASPLEAAISVRDRIRDRRIPGPTLFVSGPALESNPPPSAREYRWPVAGAPDAKSKVERIVRAGVDYVLLADADRLTAEELQTLVAGAKAAGKPVYAEVRRDTDVAPALAAGVDGLVGFGNGTADAWPEAAIQQLRARATRNEPVPWSAGVSALTNLEWLRQNREPLDDARWAEGLAPIVAHDIRSSIANPSMLSWYEMPAVRRPLVGPRLKSARDAGARLLVGSDAGVPAHLHPRATWQEIEALVLEGGMSAQDAIVAATSGAAAVLGIQHETGTLTPGKYADVVVVRGDPLRHVERLQDVQVVIRRGQRWR